MPPLGAGRFSPVLAIAWTALVTAVLWLALGLVFLAFGRGANDIALLGLTQVAVYAAVLCAFGYALGVSAQRLLALRRAPLVLCLACVVLGATLQIPATLASDIVEHFFPTPAAELAERMARITPHSTAHGIAIFLLVALLGPLVEEFFFRGALFGALRQSRGAKLTLWVVALCFVLGHLDLRLFFPLMIAALVLGQVREETGSIWPGFALHASFNSATLVLVFQGAAPEGKPPPMPLFFAILGCALSFAVLVLVRSLALSSPVAQNARRSDRVQ
jgi:hypothetical protein